jgi:undecaprenyl-diphosphatase
MPTRRCAAGVPPATPDPHDAARQCLVPAHLTLKILGEILELTLVVVCLFVALRVFVRYWQPAWSVPMQRRRQAIVWALVVAVLATKITEDVVDHESGPIDTMVLTSIQAHMPAALMGAFETITLTGSSGVLVPITTAAALLLLAARRRFEAVLLVTSTLGGAGIVYIAKTLVERTRPDLWPAQWYWGSSFPSGHTLVVAAFATAAALILARIWPTTRQWAVGAAIVWVLLVGLSRLALGVHWPTDVLAAACIGATLPLGLSLAFDHPRH